MSPELERMVRDMHGALLGNEYGQVGIVKRIANVEEKVEVHDPVILRVMEQEAEKKDERKKLRWAIISGALIFVGGLVTNIVLIFTHLK